MEPNRNYFLVGLFVLLTMLGALAFSVWLTSSNKNDYAHYKIRFAESVSGLPVGGSVKYRGVDVGSVEAIAIDPHDPRFIRVHVQILKTTPIKTDTLAALKYAGITGVVYIELSGGSPGAANLPKIMDVSRADEADIPEIKPQSSQISAIVDRIPEIMDKVSKSVEQINKALSDQNIANISSIIAQWQQISVTFNQDAKELDTMLKNGSAATKDFRDIAHDSKGNVAEAIVNINQSTQQLNSLLGDLKKTSRHINNLSESLDENPSRLIFPDNQKGVPKP